MQARGRLYGLAGREAGMRLFVDVRAHGAAHALRAGAELVLQRARTRAVIELQRPAGADGTVEQARVRADPAGVELLRVERAEEAVDADRQTGGESRPPIERDEMESRVEEVTGRVVLPSIGAQRRLREGARLLQAIDLELVGERRAGAFLAYAKLAEGTYAISRPTDPPTLVGEFAQGKISAQRPERPGNEPPDLLIFPAASFDLHAGFRLTAAAPREDVDRSTERVAAEDRVRAANDLDAFDVRERDQLEGDLFGGRFVDPHAVDEHADALRHAGNRARGEPAQGKVFLTDVSLLIGEMDPRDPLQGLLERTRAARADLARIDHLHRETVRGRPALRQSGRPEDGDLLDQSVLVARTALRRRDRRHGLLFGSGGMRAEADHQLANQRHEGRRDDPVHAALEFRPGKLPKVALQQRTKQAAGRECQSSRALPAGSTGGRCRAERTRRPRPRGRGRTPAPPLGVPTPPRPSRSPLPERPCVVPASASRQPHLQNAHP